MVRAYPPADNQLGRSHWPMLRVVVLHDVENGLAEEPCWGPMYGPQAVSEQGLAEQALDALPAPAVVIGDRNFGVFWTAHAIQQRGLGAVVRLMKVRAHKLVGPISQPGEQAVRWSASRWDGGKQHRWPGQIQTVAVSFHHTGLACRSNRRTVRPPLEHRRVQKRTHRPVGERPTEAKRLRPRSWGGAVARKQDGGALRQHARKEGDYEAVNYHRFADDIVITVSGHHTKRGWAERARQRLQEQFALIGVELNLEKTKVVDTLKGEAFGFLGFDLRRIRKRKREGYFVLMTPKKKARQAVKAKVRDIIAHGGATPMPAIVKQINATLAGWFNYFRVGNASRAFSEVRDYTEMKVRTLLTRRKRRRKSSVGWRRWSNEYLYNVLGLYWDWKIQPLPGVGEEK